MYDPGGPTGLVDDFAVATASLWPTVGRQLVEAARVRLADLGAVQLVVVCGHHDEPKRSLLQQCGLAVASEWFVAPLR